MRFFYVILSALGIASVEKLLLHSVTEPMKHIDYIRQIIVLAIHVQSESLVLQYKSNL